MRLFILTIFLFLISGIAKSQCSEAKVDFQKRLVREINDLRDIETFCLGYSCNSHSLVWLKADTLLHNSTLENAVGVYDSNSHILKYYSFFKIFELDDSVAFVRLKNSIGDTSHVIITIADMSASIGFNQLISSVYCTLLEMKYKYGGNSSWDNRAYQFPKANEVDWQTRYRVIRQLLKKYNLKEKVW